MKLDTQLQSDVSEALLWEPTISSTDIKVAVREGIVTLSGTVPHYSEKGAAERATQHVCGVKAIAEELTVNLMGEHKRKDEELARSVVSALGWHVWVPKTVHATIESGWVTLTGNAIWDYQRSAAEEALRFLSGIKGITNNITLTSGVKALAIKDAIEKVLKRDAEIDAQNIKVTTDGGKVNLSGTIRTWTERDEVANAAWSTPGVTEVKNELVVSY